MKWICLLLLAPLAGCDVETADRCEAQRLFAQCLATVPKGPDRTVSNDWAEVVEECRITAYQHSRKLPTSENNAMVCDHSGSANISLSAVQEPARHAPAQR